MCSKYILRIFPLKVSRHWFFASEPINLNCDFQPHFLQLFTLPFAIYPCKQICFGILCPLA